MTKLLHERLRDIDDDKCLGMAIADICDAETNCYLSCLGCVEGLVKSLADEIERDYIPRTEHEVEVKRPAKVLDADGAEISPGETLYRVTSGKSLVAECFEYIEAPYVTDTFGNSWNPIFLTHEKPVFDADGVRICKGDTVWCKAIGHEFIVTSLRPFVVSEKETDFPCELFLPSDFTHREPDSLERVLDEFGTIVMPTEEAYGELISRLAAIAERIR